MRDQMIKLYVDDTEMRMIQEMAEADGLPINRFLRMVLSKYAEGNGYPLSFDLFLRVYTKRNEVY